MNACTDCRASVERLEATVAQLWAASARLVEAPHTTLDRARLLLKTIRPDLVRRAAPARSSALREVFASLTFDSWQRFAFDGLRSTDTTTRHLSYESPLADLDLQAAPVPVPTAGERRWRVMGQLTMAESEPGLRAELTSAANPADQPVMVRLDDNGYFTTELLAGGYTLRIPLGDSVLVFPDLNLR